LPDTPRRLIISTVSLRLFASEIFVGEQVLSNAEAHHARDVLRLSTGDAVELFDPAGRVGVATLLKLDRRGVTVSVSSILDAPAVVGLEIACALPKGDRADWLAEKLSEIGVTRLVPLIAERSVVVPKGDGKLDRLRRIAVEAAKQSQRVGVMSVDPPMPLRVLLNDRFVGGRFVLSTQGATQSLAAALPKVATPVQLVVGPEGGWTDRELHEMSEAGLTAVSLTTTILRIETAAVVAAGCVATKRCAPHGNQSNP